MTTSTTSTTSLTAATEELRSGLKTQLGTVLDSLDAGATELGARTWPAKAVGDAAPDFELPDARGGSLTLARLRSDGPVVLVFYRGAWCPYCNLQLRSFQAALADIHAAGASLVAISPQTPDNSLTLAEQAELAFRVLSDVGYSGTNGQRAWECRGPIEVPSGAVLDAALDPDEPRLLGREAVSRVVTRVGGLRFPLCALGSIGEVREAVLCRPRLVELLDRLRVRRISATGSLRKRHGRPPCPL